MGYLFVMISGRKTGKSGGGWAEQGPKMSIYHFLWRQRSEITTNQRGQWTGRYGHKRRLRTIKKEMEKVKIEA